MLLDFIYLRLYILCVYIYTALYGRTVWSSEENDIDINNGNEIFVVLVS